MKRINLFRQADRRTRHHLLVDGQINPREWFNWHPVEYQPWYADRHLFLYEQHQWRHLHHLLCHQVFLKDMLHFASYPDPLCTIIDCRMNPRNMRRWIPHSHWLPRDEIEYALQLDPEEFNEMYGFDKPDRDSDVILVSHNGLGSEQCGWEFRKQYYLHVYNYRGGTNELFGEVFADFHLQDHLENWKGPFPQSGIFVDKWSKRKVLTRTGPFDRQYELQDFVLPDLELEKLRHESEEPRENMPYGLQ